LGAGGKRMAKAFNKLGWHWWPSYSAMNTHHHQDRPPCINLGPCNTGCPQGAKGSVDITYWPEAKKQGVEIRTECAVFDIVLDNKGRAKGVRYLDKKGIEYFQEAAVVLLAGSGIGTPRLLLNSKSPAYPDGLLNNNGLVGRNLMLHPLAYTEGVFEQNVNSSIGPHGCCILSQEFYESELKRDFVRGYTMQILRGTPPLEAAMSSYLTRRLPLGAKHHQAFSKIFNHNMGIAIISEDLPEWHNHIELDSEHCDSHGIPGIKVHYTMHENTKNMLKHGIERSKELFSASGAKVVSAFSPVKHAGWHLMGTARMGNDPKNSVVNQHGQAHAIDNLFIVDSSIFVTSGAVNPVATAQALTLKICEELRKNIKTLVRS
ncbi:MAG: GMC family oxidoreductase, partial [Colwellia sp.]